MTKFDKQIRELSRNVDIPKEYDEKIEKILRSLPEEDGKTTTLHIHGRKMVPALCVLALVAIFCFGKMDANANIFETFKLTIMDIFHIGEKEDDLGVESKQEQIEGKQDLKLELQEVITDKQSMYLLIKLTAPTNVELNEDVGFDYFAFCDGESYNDNQLIGGATDCYLLERSVDKSNEATYIVSISTDMETHVCDNVSVCFRDLTLNPYGENPELLVEGMWNITLIPEFTVKENIHLEGDDSMSFPYLGKTATVNEIEITPLGMTLVSDVSNVPFEDLGVSDTTITIRIKLINGVEYSILPYDENEEWIVDCGSREFSQEDGHSYQKDIFSFTRTIDVNKVIGFYIQDVYVPVEQ